MSKRIAYLDIAKGIAIFCVIIGHMDNRVIQNIVFSFHMPLFFLLAGFFIKRVKPWTEIVPQKARRLLLPYALTCGFVILFATLRHMAAGKWYMIPGDARDWFLASLYGSGSVHSMIFDIQPIGAVWFLLAMFFGLLLYNWVLQRRHQMIWSVLLFVVAYGAARVCWLPWSILPGMTAVLFVHIGHLAYTGGYSGSSLRVML